MTDYNDETDPNDLLDLMKPGETLEQMRTRLRKFYWRVQDNLSGATTEEAQLMAKLHRYLPWLGGYGRGEPTSQVWPGPKKDTHKTQELVRARWHNAEHTLIRMRTTEAHYIIGPDHPRWEEAKAVANPYLEQPEDVAMPEFLKAETELPAEVSEVLAEMGFSQTDSVERIETEMTILYTRYMGFAQYASKNGVYDGQGEVFWTRKAERYLRVKDWNRGRLAEKI